MNAPPSEPSVKREMPAMRLAVMQPYFFPYIGYMQLIRAVDRFVVYDDVHFIKGGWINRNRILLNGKEHLFTLPLHRPSPRRLICDIEISQQREYWSRKFLTTLAQGYARAPFYGETMALIESVLAYQTDSLSELLVFSLRQLVARLDIRTPIVPSSRVYENRCLERQTRLIDICKREHADAYINPRNGMSLYEREVFAQHNLDLRFIKTGRVKYRQSCQREFVPNLSIIDVMMFNPVERIGRFLEEYELE
jgi:hypothetical protein